MDGCRAGRRKSRRLWWRSRRLAAPAEAKQGVGRDRILGPLGDEEVEGGDEFFEVGCAFVEGDAAPQGVAVGRVVDEGQGPAPRDVGIARMDPKAAGTLAAGDGFF